ncbi:hypothetical protein B5807_07984 [Epicoccum nigrum]|uniref:RBR-type E3 ubiquitin transferase n=1 Tax=Epicoccum nigrum TaxID=105696 RepID=A0A1Y2LQK4_EPING|nr:hypothetical protein B5807_07984 [Epicoccum nigrum]
MDISDLFTEALKEQLRRREAARRQRSVSVPTDIEENSDDDSLYMTPRGVSFRSKKRHRSQSPDLLDGNANAGTARPDEDALFENSQKQWTDPRSGTKSRPIELDRTSSPFQDYTAAIEDFELQDAAIARQLHEEELQAQEERLREAASRTRNCAVCGEATLIIELPSLSSCSHEAQICSDCYATWIASQLEGNGWQGVKCPGTTCKINLTYEEVKAYAAREVFERYDTLQTRSVLSLDPNFRCCTAQGCNSGQIHDTREVGNVFTCVECRARFCTVHEGAYHVGESCREYEYRTSGQKERDERERETKASEDALGRLSKRCPNQSCNSPIQKNGGCNHITCFKCKHDFCYHCLVSNWKTCGHLHLDVGQ